ncbi:uncharacterized protein [Osmerus mordax]|uniref:uncharacterized protein n=1 Tax=Osmerus mordax TaxID=8014 RepID=UPI003510C014
MSSSNLQVSKEQFQCSICLEVFIDPVSTSCGHNFCQACISHYWNVNTVYQCPLCMETFIKRPELRVNTAFRDMVDRFTVHEVCCEDIQLSLGDMAVDLSTDGFQKNIEQFKNLVDERINKLQTIADQLLKTAEDFQDVHCSNTAGSQRGRVTGKVGGITALTGLALAFSPVSFGGSLIVAGVGLVVGVTGGVVGAIFHKKSTTHRSEVKESIEKLVATFQTLIEPIQKKVKVIKQGLVELNRLKEFLTKIDKLKLLRAGTSGTLWLVNSVDNKGILANVDSLSKKSSSSIHNICSALRRRANSSVSLILQTNTEINIFMKSIKVTASSYKKAVSELRELRTAFDKM